jgi:hypothetical protein
MSGPNRLWSGEWMAESAAARARMAERRGLGAPLDDEPPAEPLAAAPAAPPAPGALERARRRLLAAAAAIAGWWRGRRAGAHVRLVPRGRRARLIAIALVAGLAGAGVMIAVEAATGAGEAPAAAAASRAYLGVAATTSLFEPGAQVVAVVPGSPAAAAGITPGDVITSVDGRSVSSPAALQAAIAAERPGAAAQIGLDRVGQPLTVTVTLGREATGAP